MNYLLYGDGYRTENFILKELGEYKGILQSDRYRPYRKLESKDYPNIKRISCLQHIKRIFIDCGENDKDVSGVVRLINELYQQEHKHKVGTDEWTTEKNLQHRQTYAVERLAGLSDWLDEIESAGNCLPKTDLYESLIYFRNEWSAMADIFTDGNTNLDNTVERFNRYLSTSRRNSLFFGSHKGAKRAIVLYSIALTCKMNQVNMFEYLTDIINRTANRQHNTPIQIYRDLFSDRWKNG